MNKVDRVPAFTRLIYLERQIGHKEISKVISDYKKCYEEIIYDLDRRGE